MSGSFLHQNHLPKSQSDQVHWYGLSPSVFALCLAEAANVSAEQGAHQVMVVLTDGPEACQTLRESVAFFLQDEEYPLLEFPDWETLAYDSFSPHQDIISTRVKTLVQLRQLRSGIIFLPVETGLSRLCPMEYLGQTTFLLSKGQSFNITKERMRLEHAGYFCVDTVQEHGEFAVRGAIVDLFPMGSEYPIRIELFDDEIETLRYFDPSNQRSIDVVDEIKLLPAREMPLSPSGIERFKTNFKEIFDDVDYRRCGFYQDVIEGIAFPGIEYYLPLFFEKTASFFDYLPKEALLVCSPELPEKLRSAWSQIEERYESRRHDISRPVLAPQQLYWSVEQFFQQLNDFARIQLHAGANPSATKTNHHQFITHEQPDVQVESKKQEPLARFQTFLADREKDGLRTLLCAESLGRREVLKALLEKHHLHPKDVADWPTFLASDALFCLTVVDCLTGFELPKQGVSVVAEHQLLGQRVQQTRRQAQPENDAYENMVRSLTEISEGAPVVHIDHGVGRYRGLQNLTVDGQVVEFLLLEYADEAKLYVPVDSLHLISRYSGLDEDLAPLHKLGAAHWEKEKRKAAEKIHDVAAELLNIYAARAAKPGFEHDCQTEDYALFCAAFPFQETHGQASAIADVEKDMAASTPMDRLICGDVGFGKTEVAMRAAFIAIQNHRQVAVLVPTTLLAQQHYESFQDRFADWPVKVGLLSRFKTAKEQQEIIKQLKAGEIDIVVGTHKLLHGSTDFKSLGLLIIDEEHRFGVKQKEKLKAMRSDVDILTMTATPIPRTLNMSLAGLRDISIISTPPEKRLAIKTFVRSHEGAVIKEAILRELHRGGQVYYLHNEVKTIERTADFIKELVPEARVGVAHGQMRERELESVMADFYHRRFNVLVCTTIIETGIDVPTANTIIMDRADKLGLAQLHQLRGRVGRSHHQAYAYLLTVDRRSLSGDAEKRLEAIAQTQTLGAGFSLASQDMEIRGAGEFLGDEQSGQVQSIGLTLFLDMLNESVKAIKEGKTPNLDQPVMAGPEINLRVPALIPEDYLRDVGLRLILYKRIANTKTEAELEDLQIEMVDRFGMVSEPTKNLFEVTRIRQIAQSLGISKIEFSDAGGMIEFGKETQVNPLILVNLVQKFVTVYQLSGADRLRVKKALPEAKERIAFVDELLRILSGEKTI